MHRWIGRASVYRCGLSFDSWVCRRVVSHVALPAPRVRSTISRPVRIRRRIIDALRGPGDPGHGHVARAPSTSRPARSPSSPSGSAPCRRRLRLGTASSRSTAGDALSSMRARAMNASTSHHAYCCGQNVAFMTSGATYDVWVYNLARGNARKLISDGSNQFPIWTPDGKRVTYRATRAGTRKVFWRTVDGCGDEERLTTLLPTHNHSVNSCLFFS